MPHRASTSSRADSSATRLALEVARFEAAARLGRSVWSFVTSPGETYEILVTHASTSSCARRVILALGDFFRSSERRKRRASKRQRPSALSSFGVTVVDARNAASSCAAVIRSQI
eukprot:3588623-Prymnesium_polylepis.2